MGVSLQRKLLGLVSKPCYEPAAVLAIPSLSQRSRRNDHPCHVLSHSTPLHVYFHLPAVSHYFPAVYSSAAARRSKNTAKSSPPGTQTSHHMHESASVQALKVVCLRWDPFLTDQPCDSERVI